VYKIEQLLKMVVEHHLVVSRAQPWLVAEKPTFGDLLGAPSEFATGDAAA
jgi:hypothetical protein